MSDTPSPITQQATAGPRMLALAQQIELDSLMAGILYARLVRRGYRERAVRAMNDGNAQGVAETYAITAAAKELTLGQRLF